MTGTTKIIVFGAGCFWCTEAVFTMMRGVIKVTPGYAGGTTPDPTYESVCGGRTGHAEVLEIEYDPNIISLDNLLEIFLAMHDPTTKDRQGADFGSEYRSIILYNTEDEKKIIQDYIKKAQPEFEKPIVTEVAKLTKFYIAEDYHQKFYENNRFSPYCMIVINPKLKKVKKEFGNYIDKPL